MTDWPSSWHSEKHQYYNKLYRRLQNKRQFHVFYTPDEICSLPRDEVHLIEKKHPKSGVLPETKTKLVPLLEIKGHRLVNNKMLNY